MDDFSDIDEGTLIKSLQDANNALQRKVVSLELENAELQNRLEYANSKNNELTFILKNLKEKK